MDKWENEEMNQININLFIHPSTFPSFFDSTDLWVLQWIIAVTGYLFSAGAFQVRTSVILRLW